MLFEHCSWINHPAATYLAEHKALQLATASKLGFPVPATILTNWTGDVSRVLGDQFQVAIKGLDTVLVRDGSDELFGYTEIVELASLQCEALASIPITVQEALDPKIDLRVTVLDDHLWCASVTNSGNAISGDWRRMKVQATFESFALPPEISALCRKLIQQLGLRFGAIDLALMGHAYYFLEVNPTGEWAWLENTAGFPIARELAAVLSGH